MMLPDLVIHRQWAEGTPEDARGISSSADDIARSRMREFHQSDNDEMPKIPVEQQN